VLTRHMAKQTEGATDRVIPIYPPNLGLQRGIMQKFCLSYA